MLQFSPILALGSITQNCQILVDSGTITATPYKRVHLVLF